MKVPGPIEWLVIHSSLMAALSAVWAPVFGNNPAEMGLQGFLAGLLTGLPVYVWATMRRQRQGKR